MRQRCEITELNPMILSYSGAMPAKSERFSLPVPGGTSTSSSVSRAMAVSLRSSAPGHQPRAAGAEAMRAAEAVNGGPETCRTGDPRASRMGDEGSWVWSCASATRRTRISLL